MSLWNNCLSPTMLRSGSRGPSCVPTTRVSLCGKYFYWRQQTVFKNDLSWKYKVFLKSILYLNILTLLWKKIFHFSCKKTVCIYTINILRLLQLNTCRGESGGPVGIHGVGGAAGGTRHAPYHLQQLQGPQTHHRLHCEEFLPVTTMFTLEEW